MTAEYPKPQQNPPTEEGERPGEQPEPQQRVPDNFEQDTAHGDPRNIDSGWEPGEHLEGFQERAREDLTDGQSQS